MAINTSKPIFIEQNIPLKNSQVWEMQRNFYSNQGVQAWNAQVPFYVTSNPYIANSYAHIILRFAQDALINRSASSDQPFYIVELGAGSGTFSFYTIKRLFALRDELHLQAIRFVYVMTDRVPENLAFWQQHPQLQSHIAQGHVDFALFDAEKDTTINLIRSDIRLSEDLSHQTKNPLILLVNYVFDTLKQDLFQLNNGQISECFSTLTTAEEYQQSPRLEQTQLHLSYETAVSPYYEDAMLEALLHSYSKDLASAYLLIPAGAIDCLKKMAAIGGQRLCTLISDKGFTRHVRENLAQPPAFVLHSGCFSLPLNFDAIGRFFKSKGGSVYHQFTEHSLDTSLFTCGVAVGTMPEFRLAAETYLDGFGHASIFKMYEHLENTKQMSSIDTLLPFLAASRWDPHIFNTNFDLIIQQIRGGAVWQFQVEDLADIMDKLAENYYPIPGATDTLMNIGIFFFEIKAFEKAIYWLEQSLTTNGPSEQNFVYMGLCHYHLAKFSAALNYFKAAVAEKADHIFARGWIAQIEYELTQKEK